MRGNDMKKKKFINSGYSTGAANRERPTLKTWYPQHFSALSDIEQNLNLLRNRSYDLSINSALGSAALNTMVSGVVGNGLNVFPTPKFKELGLTAESAREWARRVQFEFEMWANSLTADFFNRNNFKELQRVIFNASLADGDAFCIFRRRNNAPYSLCLQILEAKRVSNPQSYGAINPVEVLLPNEHKIINGIEVDKFGRQVAIHVSNRIWDEPLSTTAELKWQRVKTFGENGTRNVLQICYDTTPGQFRGVPLLAPVIETLKQVARYSDAELTSSIIRSFFSLFFVQPASNFNLNEMLPQEEIDVSEYRLGSGTISALPKGVDIKSVEANNAQNTFDSFITQFSKQIGAAIGIPYEVLLKNFQSSYSASRASILEAEKTFKQRRAGFILDFLQPVYETFLIEAVATGRINAPHFFDNETARYLWSCADFRREVSPGIDPVKDVNAAKTRIELGISTREIEAVRNGEDFWNIAEQLKRENELLN